MNFSLRFGRIGIATVLLLSLAREGLALPKLKPAPKKSAQEL